MAVMVARVASGPHGLVLRRLPNEPFASPRNAASPGSPQIWRSFPGAIPSHDTEGTRLGHDIQVNCPGTLIPRTSDFGSMRRLLVSCRLFVLGLPFIAKDIARASARWCRCGRS